MENQENNHRENMAELLRLKAEKIGYIGKRISENNSGPDEIPVITEKKEAAEKKEPFAAERDRLLGKWRVTEHKISGKDYLAEFNRVKLGGKLVNPVYESEYYFNGRVCIKKVLIKGNLLAEGGGEEKAYAYKIQLTLSYRMERPIKLAVITESGYLNIQAGDEPPVIREYEPDGRESLVSIQFGNEELILEEETGGDFKRLVRLEK